MHKNATVYSKNSNIVQKDWWGRPNWPPPKFFQIGVDFSLWSHYNLIVPTEKKEVKLLGIKKGTRLTDTPKDREFKFRYDADTEMKIQAICEATGKTKAQVIREGIDKLYDEIQSGR